MRRRVAGEACVHLVEVAVEQFARQTANLLAGGEQARREWDSNPRDP